MRVLIIGCGYVGLPLGAELVRQGLEVFGLRRSGAASAEMESAGIQPLIGDITQPGHLSRLPTDYDWVVDAISASGGGLDAYRAVYLEGARHLVDWLGASPPKKFVYTSSTGVYGQTDGSTVDESSPTEPAADTARILIEAECVLLEAARRRGFPAVVLRLAGIYGPGRGYWLKQHLSGEMRIQGDGRRYLNMVHRDDAIGAIIAALRRGRPGQVYNVVDNEPVPQRVLFEWFCQHFGGAMPPSVPAEPAGQSKRGITDKKVGNLKLTTELGYHFNYPTFREGFRAV
jgi:nucleoside-diphosphate-sugar epimerase